MKVIEMHFENQWKNKKKYWNYKSPLDNYYKYQIIIYCIQLGILDWV